MKWFKLPIMLGCYDEADKCAVVGHDKRHGGRSLLICRTKERQPFGTIPSMDNVRNVICHIHFCKLESAKAFRDVLDMLIKEWEDGEDNGKAD